MFMISASAALAAIMSTTLALSMVVDEEHRIRVDRMTDRKFAVWQYRDALVTKSTDFLLGLWNSTLGRIRRSSSRRGENDGEREPLLGG
jgi:hypothetical protein